MRVPESGAESGGGSLTIIPNNPLTEFLFFLETLSSVGLQNLGSKKNASTIRHSGSIELEESATLSFGVLYITESRSKEKK